jgi:hypothetical protein
MFNIPETYRKDKDADLRAFIPKDLNPNDKKRLRESLKAVRYCERTFYGTDKL